MASVNTVLSKFNKNNNSLYVQVIRKGKPNAKAYVVGFTPKRVRLQIMDGNKYVYNADGSVKNTLVDPKNIKFYAETVSENVETSEVADEATNELETVEEAETEEVEEAE